MRRRKGRSRQQGIFHFGFAGPEVALSSAWRISAMRSRGANGETSPSRVRVPARVSRKPVAPPSALEQEVEEGGARFHVRRAAASTARGSLREVQQGEQRIVHRLGSWEGACDAGIENDHVGALLETFDIFPTDELAEVGTVVL